MTTVRSSGAWRPATSWPFTYAAMAAAVGWTFAKPAQYALKPSMRLS